MCHNNSDSDKIEKYLIRPIQPEDYATSVKIYNSNPQFLLAHLGVDFVERAFIVEEAVHMTRAGFHSCVIVNTEKQAICGVLDYGDGEEVYLSLLVLAAELQGQGAGREIYSLLERTIAVQGTRTIRIDVVNGYPGSAALFWKKLGFRECGEVTLQWGEKRSNAVVMRKKILGLDTFAAK